MRRYSLHAAIATGKQVPDRVSRCFLLAGDSDEPAVRHDLVAALQGQTKGSVWGSMGDPSSPRTQSEKDAMADYRWPPREVSLPAL